MAEEFGVEDRGHFYDPVGALRDVVVNHMMQLLAAAAMEAPAGADASTINDAKFALFRAMPDADPAHYVRGQYEGYLDVPGVAAGRRRRPTWRCAWRSTTGAGPGCRSSCAPASACPRPRRRSGVVFKRPPRLGFVATDKRPPEPSQLVVRLDPTTGVRLVLDAQRAGETVPGPITLDMDFADEGGEGATPYEVLLHDAMEGDARASRGRTARRRSGGSCSRCSTRRGRCTPTRGARGDHRRRTGSSPAWAAGTSRGRRHERHRGEEARPRPPARPRRTACRRAPPRRRRSRRSPTTPSSRTATRARSSRPTARIGWLCVPSFDAPSVFGTLLDREAGSFRMGPFGIDVPTSRHYVPGTTVLETTWHCPTGWAVVQDALTVGPRRGEDTVTPHTRPPADVDGDHLLVRTVECHRRERGDRARVRAGLRLRARDGDLDAARRGPPRRRRAPGRTSSSA